MLQKIWWLIQTPGGMFIPGPVKYNLLFIWRQQSKETVDGQFTAYHANESAEEYWNKWLKRRDDRDPSNLMKGFGLCLADTGFVESEEQFQQLLRKIGRVSK